MNTLSAKFSTMLLNLRKGLSTIQSRINLKIITKGYILELDDN